MKNKQETSLNAAQRNNQNVATFLRQFIGASFGPKGLSKLRSNEYGDVFVLQDCKTILEKADLKHPIAKMMLDVAKFLHAKWGDGSASAVLVSNMLIEKGFDLVEKGVHVSKVIDGFEYAKEESCRLLGDPSTMRFDLNPSALSKVIASFLMSKLEENDAIHLTSVIDYALNAVMSTDLRELDADMIKITAKGGAPVSSSCALSGVAVDSEVVSASMPESVMGARIAIAEELLDVRKTKFDAEIRVNSPSSLRLPKQSENKIVEDLVKPVIDSKANVLLTHKGISDIAQGMLASAKILAVRRIGLVDLRRISKATDARIANSTSELTEEYLGYASTVQQKTLAGSKCLFIEGCRNPRAISVILRAGSQRKADELEDLAKRTIRMVEATTKDPALIVGGGAPELAVYKHLHSYALQFAGREQLAIQAFGEAILLLAETLAKNCGIEPVDIRTRMLSLSQKGLSWINPVARSIEQQADTAPLEPLGMKKDIIACATEVANTILRIGDTYPVKEDHRRKEREPDYP